MERSVRSDFFATLRDRQDTHLLRKLWHVSLGLFGLLAYYLNDSVDADLVIKSTLGLSAAGFLVETIRLKVPSVNKQILKVMGPFMRSEEKDSYSGLPFYALGVGLSLFLYDEKIAVLSIFFLVFADPISSYFGIRYGRDKIFGNKSLQGATAGYIVCYVITLFYGLIHYGPGLNLMAFAMIAGLIGTVSELVSIYIDDNLTIPLLSGAGLTLLNGFLPIFS